MKVKPEVVLNGLQRFMESSRQVAWRKYQLGAIRAYARLYPSVLPGVLNLPEPEMK